jgi:fumarylacetoacetase
MGPQIVISPASPFTVDNIPFGVIKTAKDSTPRCASAIGDYAIDLSLYAQAGNLNAVKEGFDLTDIFSRVRFKALLAHLRGEFEFADTGISSTDSSFLSSYSQPSTLLRRCPERPAERYAPRSATM